MDATAALPTHSDTTNANMCKDAATGLTVSVIVIGALVLLAVLALIIVMVLRARRKAADK